MNILFLPTEHSVSRKQLTVIKKMIRLELSCFDVPPIWCKLSLMSPYHNHSSTQSTRIIPRASQGWGWESVLCFLLFLFRGSLFPTISETQLSFPCSQIFFPLFPLFPVIYGNVPLLNDTPGGASKPKWNYLASRGFFYLVASIS